MAKGSGSLPYRAWITLSASPFVWVRMARLPPVTASSMPRPRGREVSGSAAMAARMWCNFAFSGRSLSSTLRNSADICARSGSARKFRVSRFSSSPLP
ncbi:hypothetical protein D3C86_864160 [compost metagenome]